MSRREELKAVKLSEFRGEPPKATAPTPAPPVDEWQTVPQKSKGKPDSKPSSSTVKGGGSQTNAWGNGKNVMAGGSSGRQGGSNDVRKVDGKGFASNRERGGNAGPTGAVQRQSSNDSSQESHNSRSFKSGQSGSFRGSNSRGESKDRKFDQVVAPTPVVVKADTISEGLSVILDNDIGQRLHGRWIGKIDLDHLFVPMLSELI